MRVKAGKEQAARDAFIAVVNGSQAEPGCVAYSFTSDVADPALTHVLEMWEDEAALHAHFGREPFQTFMAVSGDLIDPVGAAAYQGDLAPYALALG